MIVKSISSPLKHHKREASVSRTSSHNDLRWRKLVSPPLSLPSVIRAGRPRSHLPYPTGDYQWETTHLPHAEPGSVMVSHGVLSPHVLQESWVAHLATRLTLWTDLKSQVALSTTRRLDADITMAVHDEKPQLCQPFAPHIVGAPLSPSVC
jgi:hypothetical protein